jgi:tripartite-type tricarboxylate transporter receptor subunit TctC
VLNHAQRQSFSRRNVLKSGLAMAGVALPGLTSAFGQASGYPNKLVKLIVPFPAGGNFDIIARTYSNPLAEALGQTIVVENRAGAAGTIGTTAAARAAPDGYTLVIGDIASLCINRFANADLQYEPIKDFAPISLAATVSVVVTARKDFPASTFQEFLALARANSRKFTCGTGGTGSLGHLALELLMSMTAIEIVHVPYRGGALAATDLLGGHIDLLIDGAALSYARDGLIKPLAATGDRIQALPNVPTIAEAGVPGFHLENFWGFLAPIGTPAPIIERINVELNRIAAAPAVRGKLESGGIRAKASTPQELASIIRSSTDKIGEIVMKANIKFG